MHGAGTRLVSLFSGPNCPPNAGFGIKNLKKFSGNDTPGPPQRDGATPSRTHPSTATRRARGRKLSRCCDVGLGNRPPLIKIYHYTPAYARKSSLESSGIAMVETVK